MQQVIGIVAVVFAFVTVVSIAGIISETKVKKMKIEAALRKAEMEHGYAPGTYSRSFSSKSDNTFGKDLNEMGKEGITREDLEKGIRDLEKRIENIDLIMKERKEGRKDD